MGTGQILKEVFEKKIEEQITELEKIAETNCSLDMILIRDALRKIVDCYYEK